MVLSDEVEGGCNKMKSYQLGHVVDKVELWVGTKLVLDLSGYNPD